MPTDIGYLDLTLSSPAENLACDEALLDDREARDGPGVLRFWESPVPFIVVGYAARVAEEVVLHACEARTLPILRRCSGGGTVVQGVGCLNYSLILPLDAVGPAATITETNCFIMQRHRDALEKLLRQPVTVAGYTDLVLGDRKFSGNAQRRKRRWFLFHGTFLLGFDLSLIEQVLQSPHRQPAYRRERGHLEFVTCLAVEPDRIKEALRMAWETSGPIDSNSVTTHVTPIIERLVHERYGREEWNRGRK